MANPQIAFEIYDEYIDIYIPLTSRGKFRCKTRNDFQEYGTSFGPKKEIIKENAYVEWQIGYDKVADDDKKTTKLSHLTFVGANGKIKNPYELSELVYFLCEKGIIKKTEIEKLITTIENIETHLQDSFTIQAKKEKEITFNNEEFYKSTITLPTFNKTNPSCSVTTQISIEKQQYATGIQPMLYMNIPVKEFENKDKIIGNTSKKEKYGILRINNQKSDILKILFYVLECVQMPIIMTY